MQITTEAEDLAAHILGLNENAPTSLIEKELLQRFELGLDNLSELIEVLLPLIDVGTSPLTETRFKGFSNQDGQWFAKTEIK